MPNAGIIVTKWTEVEPRFLVNEKAKRVTPVPRRHRVRIVLRGDSVLVAVDCTERLPNASYWRMCADDSRNIRYAQQFTGLAEAIVREIQIDLAAKRRREMLERPTAPPGQGLGVGQ